jgi:hypothetical protein
MTRATLGGAVIAIAVIAAIVFVGVTLHAQLRQ